MAEFKNKQDTTEIKPNTEKYPQIYGYTLKDKILEKKGYIKVGYTERKNVKKRIKEQESTAAFHVHPHFEFKRDAIFEKVNKSWDGKWFTDKQLHKFFIRNGAKREGKSAGNSEWFTMPNQKIPDWAENLTDRYRKQDFKIETGYIEKYSLREEQKQAVDKTLVYYKENDDPRFLWNAKPRFGKTLTAYDFAIKAGFTKILVATNRPAIANSWYQDYEKFIGPDEYIFISTADSLKNQDTNPWVYRYKDLTEEQKDSKQICFFSLQDLKGAKWAGGKISKLNWVCNTNWDLLIIDEAHEGAETIRADKLFSKIKRKFTLYLSGTPFTALKRGEFNEDQIFTWSYEDEQREKLRYSKEHPGTSNPYENPTMSLFTYRLSDMLKDKALEDIDQGNYSYDLKSFFATKRDKNGTPKFIHEEQVKQFLKALSSEEKFPFTENLRKEMKHTLWLLDRVDSARALQNLLESGSTEIDKFTGKPKKDYNPFKAAFNVIRAYGSSSKDSSTNTSEQDEKQQLKEISDNNKNISSYNRVIQGIKKAEKEGKGTITISCGQLTTGVTIKPWSGVLMLNNTTSPSLYMQAAFRAQNAYEFNENGKHYRKEHAYIFDFSPERALEVYGTFATGLESQPITNHKKYDDQITQMVKLFPVITENDDGKMQETDTETIVSLPQKYKSDKVFEQGFSSSYLINDIALNIVDADIVNTLKSINLENAASNSLNNKSTIPINDNGLHSKKSGKKEKASPANKRENESKQIKEKAKEIAKVMPSLIFAYADENVNLDNFADNIPDDVIKEIFSIDKNTFTKILNSGLYNGPVFHQAALDLLKLSKKVKTNFSLNNLEELFSKLPSISSNLVYTPIKVVERMLDLLEKNHPGIFDNPDLTFFDPFVKSGSFIYGIISKLFNNKSMKHIFPNDHERLNNILKRQVFGNASTKLFKDMSNKLLPEEKIVYYRNVLNYEDEVKGELNDMKFDVVIGNPPYQNSDGGAKASATPIYNKFVDLSRKLNPDFITLIIPSRWYTGGKGLKEFRNSMLDDIHIKALYDFKNPEEVFPHTNIRGGVCIFIWEKEYDNSSNGTKVVTFEHDQETNVSHRPLNSLGLNIFIRDSHAFSILEKVGIDDNSSFMNIVSVRKPFGLGGTFTNKKEFHKSAKNIEKPVKIYGRDAIGYTSINKITKNQEWVDKVKVFTARANNIGTELNDDNLNAFVGDKGTASTETYLAIGANLNLSKSEANNIVKYLKTKFVRYLISISKSSQDAARGTYRFVPMQDFTSNSDINWSETIPEIDQQLYEKYDFSNNEIDFIEAKVQAME